MYKVSYYASTGSSIVATKNFDTFEEASDFSLQCPRESVLEIKLYPDTDTAKEDRT